MNRFHGRVKAHGPAPKQSGALRGCATVSNLLDFTLTAKAADRQNRSAVHREEQHRAVEEDNRQSVEGVVKQVAIAYGERGRPIQVGKDAEGYGLRPGTHQNGAEQAQHQKQPDGCGKGPWNVGSHAQLAGAPVGTGPPKEHGRSQESTREQPPPPLVHRREAQAVFGCRWLQRQPEQLAHKLDRIPIHRGQHIEADKVESQCTQDERSHAQTTEVDRADLRVAEHARPVGNERLAGTRAVTVTQFDALVRRANSLNRGEKILVLRHVVSP